MADDDETMIEELLLAAETLLERLDELPWGDQAQMERDYEGHVMPAIARLRAAIAAIDAGAP